MTGPGVFRRSRRSGGERRSVHRAVEDGRSRSVQAPAGGECAAARWIVTNRYLKSAAWCTAERHPAGRPPVVQKVVPMTSSGLPPGTPKVAACSAVAAVARASCSARSSVMPSSRSRSSKAESRSSSSSAVGLKAPGARLSSNQLSSCSSVMSSRGSVFPLATSACRVSLICRYRGPRTRRRVHQKPWESVPAGHRSPGAICRPSTTDG